MSDIKSRNNRYNTDRDYAEESEVRRRPAGSRKKKISKKKLKRMRQLAITGLIITTLVLITTFIFIFNCLSDKEELRDQGIAEFEKGNYEQAEQLLKDSVAEKQWFSESMDLDSRVYIAECALKSEDYARAISLFTELKDKYSDKEFIEERIAFADAMKSFSVDKDYAAAAAKLEPLAAKGNDGLYMYLGACYGKLGEDEKMLSAFETYISKYNMNSFIAYELSSYYLGIDENDKASEMINLGYKSGDTEYEYLLKYNEAVILEKKMNYNEAFNIINSLHSEYPDNEEIEKEYDFLYSRINIDEEPVNSDN